MLVFTVVSIASWHGMSKAYKVGKENFHTTFGAIFLCALRGYARPFMVELEGFFWDQSTVSFHSLKKKLFGALLFHFLYDNQRAYYITGTVMVMIDVLGINIPLPFESHHPHNSPFEPKESDKKDKDTVSKDPVKKDQDSKSISKETVKDTNKSDENKKKD